MKEINIDDIEIGNLLWGHSRGKYQLTRDEWQDVFVDFLESNGFDFYGFVNDEKLEKYVHCESGMEAHYLKCEIDSQTIMDNGVFIREDVGFDKVYLYNDEKYYLSFCAGDDFQEAWDKWYEIYDRFADDEVPQEIQDEEPSELDYSYTYDVYKIEETPGSQHYFDNGTFQVRPYYWGESDELASKPNFYFKPKDIVINWYKYPLRDSYINKDITFDEFKQMLADCKKSLQEN